VAELVFSHLFSGVRFLQDSNRKMPVSGNTEFAKLKKITKKELNFVVKLLVLLGLEELVKKLPKLLSDWDECKSG
jgi:D-3-phosphoglycerate dehydrogenase